MPTNDQHPTSLDEAVHEFRLLTKHAAALEAQVKEYSDVSNKLAAENAALQEQGRARESFYREQITTLTGQRDRLQRKCVALITRLRGIKETIVAAEREAHDEAVTDPAADTSIRLSDKDEKELAALGLGKTAVAITPSQPTLAMLPSNRFQ